MYKKGEWWFVVHCVWCSDGPHHGGLRGGLPAPSEGGGIAHDEAKAGQLPVDAHEEPRLHPESEQVQCLEAPVEEPLEDLEPHHVAYRAMALTVGG